MTAASQLPTAQARPLVVLLHGLARREQSMAKLARALRLRGWDTWAMTYPSRRASIPTCAAHVAARLAAIAGDRPLYAVTHSMGGIVARHLQGPDLNWQRMVMLAPPNQGSQLARQLAHNPLFRWFYGPAGVELADSAPWPAPPCEFAVIAGTQQFAFTNPTSWAFGRRLSSENRTIRHDGTVAAPETKLPGMAGYVEIAAPHTWIMNHPTVLTLIDAYFRSGQWPAVGASAS